MLSERQQQVVRHGASDKTLLVAAGAVRSGKSWSVQLAFAAWLLGQRGRFDHALIGQSVEAAMRNVGFDLIDTLQKLGARVDLDKRYGTRLLVRYDGGPIQSVWVLGAADERARRRIQGSTLKGLVIEEMTLLLRDVWNYAWTRLSVQGAKCWASLNPEGPSHWCKRQVIDQIEDFNGSVVEFLMKDNPSLDADTIARYESSLTGHMRKRLIEGLWSAASGACFPDWTTVSEDPGYERMTWRLCLDWAVSGTLAVLAVQLRGDKQRACVRHELYRVGADEGLLVEEDVAQLVLAWWNEQIGQPARGVSVLVDPATPMTFQRALSRRGFHVRGGVNDVLPGIVSTASRLASGAVVVHSECVRLLEELAGYVWDEKKAEIGIDEPVKRADHGVDALRYFVHTVMPHSVRRQLEVKQVPVRMKPVVRPVLSSRGRGALRAMR